MEFGKIITVDFERKLGRINKILGLNTGPVFDVFGQRVDLSSAFSEMNSPFVRLSDIEAPYGKNQFVDIHCIFPDPSADEELAESYNFKETDKYIAKIRELGSEVIFRLGESLDFYETKLYIGAPRDLPKLARICEHIVMHYNEGFAGGYKWNIKRWEIWNLPECDYGFSGSEEEFFSLYSTLATHLKERFPKIKVGGYGALGFSALNRLDSDEAHKASAGYLDRFLEHIKSHGAPLDFFSWYAEFESPEEVALHAQYARNILDGRGYRRTESCVAGFNMLKARADVYVGYASDLLASLIVGYKSNVKLMVYSDARAFGEKNRLYTLDTQDLSKPRFTSAMLALSVFGRLASMKEGLEVLGDSRRELYTVCAKDAERAILVIVAREYSGKVEIRLKSSDFSRFSVKRIYEGAECMPKTQSKADINLSGNKIAISAEKCSIYVLEFEK